MKKLQELFVKLKEFITQLVAKFTKKPVVEDQKPVEPTTPVVEPTKPVEPETPKPLSPTEAFLGGKLPPAPTPRIEPQPVEVKPYFAEGFILTKGHPVRNTLSAGEHTFTFSLPEGTSYQVDVTECSGTEDGTVTVTVVDNEGNVEAKTDTPMNIRMCPVYGAGKAGPKTVKVTLNRDNTFATVVYF